MIFFVILYNISFVQMTKAQHVDRQHYFRVLYFVSCGMAMLRLLHDSELRTQAPCSPYGESWKYEFVLYVQTPGESLSSPHKASGDDVALWRYELKAAYAGFCGRALRAEACREPVSGGCV